jgi:hypothetical protein
VSKSSTHQLVALGIAGIAAALSGCSGSKAPPESAAGHEPSGEKHGCKTDAEGKHVCGAKMQETAPSTRSPDDDEGGTPEKVAP